METQPGRVHDPGLNWMKRKFLDHLRRHWLEIPVMLGVIALCLGYMSGHWTTT